MATRPSYFRERARNPYLRARPPAPGLEEEDPNASPLAPTFPRAMPLQPEVVARPDMPASFLGPLSAGGGLPGGARATVPGMPAPAPEPTPAPTLDIQRAEYMAKAPTTTKGRIFEALKTAGLGFLQGAARDPNNPIAAGLGGAAAGGIISAVSPRTGRAYQFETIQRPGIEDRMRREEAQRQKARQAEEDALNDEYRRAQTRALDRSNLPRQLPPPRPVSTPRGALDPGTRTIIPGTEPLPKESTPQRVWTDKGMVDVSKLSPEELSKLRPYQRPRQSGGGGGGRSTKPPQGSFAYLNELDQLRRDAMDAWRQVSEPKLEEGESDTPQLKEGRRRAAQASLDEYNQAVQRFGDVFGDSFETGIGEGGWGYVQRRGGRQARPAAAQKKQDPLGIR